MANTKKTTKPKREKKRYEVDDTIEVLAEQVAKENPIVDILGINVKYLKVYPYINKKTVGKCLRTGPELKMFSNADYLIEVSGMFWDQVGDEDRYTLLLHQLMHIMVILNTKDGETKYTVRQHDVQDFEYIISNYGVDRTKRLKDLFASVHDLTPSERDLLTF